MSTNPAPATAAAIPVFSPSTAPLPAPTSGAAANINNLAQTFLNFEPVLSNARSAIAAAAQAPAADPFHQFLNVFAAADASITPYVPNSLVQSIGGLGVIAAGLLSLIPAHQQVPAPMPNPALSASATMAQVSAAAVTPAQHITFKQRLDEILTFGIVRPKTPAAPAAPVPVAPSAPVSAPAPSAAATPTN